MTGAARRRRLQFVRRQGERRRERARERLAAQDADQLEHRIERDMLRIRLARARAQAEYEQEQTTAHAAAEDLRTLFDALDEWSPAEIQFAPEDSDAALERLRMGLQWTRERLLETIALADVLLQCDCPNCRRGIQQKGA